MIKRILSFFKPTKKRAITAANRIDAGKIQLETIFSHFKIELNNFMWADCW